MPDLIPIYKHTLGTLSLQDWNQRYKNSYVLLNNQIQYIHSVVAKDGAVCFAIPKPVAKKEKKPAPVIDDDVFVGWDHLAEEILPDHNPNRAAGAIGLRQLLDIPPPPEPRRDFDEAITGIPHSAVMGNVPEKSSYVYVAIDVVSSALFDDPAAYGHINLFFTRRINAETLVLRLLEAQQYWYDLSVKEEYRNTLEQNMRRALVGDHEKYRPMIRAMPGELWEFFLFYMKNIEQSHFWMQLDFGDNDHAGRAINSTIRSLFQYLMDKLVESAMIGNLVRTINEDVDRDGHASVDDLTPQLFRSVMSFSAVIRTELARLCGATIRWPLANNNNNWVVADGMSVWNLRAALERYRQTHGAEPEPRPRRIFGDRFPLQGDDIPAQAYDYIPVAEANIELRRPRSRWYWSKGAKGQDIAVFFYSPNRRQFTRGLTPENACTMFLDGNSRHIYPNARMSEQQKTFYQDAYLRVDDRPQQRSVSELKKCLKSKGLTTEILCPEIAMTAKSILYRNQEIAELGDNEEVTLHHRFRHMELELGELLTNPKFIYGYNR